MMYDKLREPDRKKVAEFVQGTAGIQLPVSKVSLMETRLRKRQKALEVVDLCMKSSRHSNEV
ncbi:hypothetical protein ACFOEW_02600 [Alteromonas oceani]|uniref:Uncharacterized protein n=1 Tax=Alteromonas oceani TaxID=2071609 RepID=A0ABV7JWQ0_9ALTE|nr:hypothetical protein [Alteromonas oceani]